MNNYSFIPPAITTVLLVIFVLGSFRNFRSSKQYRALFYLCICTIWWHGSWVLLFLAKNEATATFVAKFGHVGVLGLPFLYSYFYSVLAEKDSDFLITKACTYFFFLFCLLFSDLIVQGVSLFPWGYYPKPGSLHFLFLCTGAVLVIRSLYLSFRAIDRTTDPSKKKILQTCQAGGIIYAFASVDFLVNYRILTTYPFGFAFSVVFLGLAAYAVLNSSIFSEEALLAEARQSLDNSRKFNESLESALKEKERELKAIEADLVQSEKLASLGTLVAGISHEINNSLNFVSGAIRTIERNLKYVENQAAREEITVVFEPMKTGVKLISAIITNLKSYSRKDTGDLSKVNLSSVLATITTLLKSKLTADIQLLDAIPADFEIIASYAGMNQLLMNLISNAIDALHGKGTIEISAQKDATCWMLKVKDSGEGIPQEILNKIFDPFFTTKEVGKGTGLGLYVVQKETKRHQGEICIESVVGKGTTFSLKFPFLAAPPSLPGNSAKEH